MESKYTSYEEIKLQSVAMFEGWSGHCRIFLRNLLGSVEPPTRGHVSTKIYSILMFWILIPSNTFDWHGSFPFIFKEEKSMIWPKLDK